MPRWDTNPPSFDREDAFTYPDQQPPANYPVQRRTYPSQFKNPYLPSDEPEDQAIFEYPSRNDRRQTLRRNAAPSRRSRSGRQQSTRPPSARNTRRTKSRGPFQRLRQLASWQNHRRLIIVLALLLLIVGVTGTSALFAYATINDAQASLASAQGHLRQAQGLLPQLSQSPLNHALLDRLRQQVVAAESDFLQAQSQASILAPVQYVPGLSQKAQDALILIQMGVDLTGAAHEVLDALLPLADGLHGVGASPHPTPGASATPGLTTTPGPTQGLPPALTTEEFTTAQAALKDASARVNEALTLRRQIQDNGASLGAQAVKGLASFDHLLPSLNQAFSDISLLLQAAPVVLGTTQPVTYLIEMLDASELRSGGGFVGNYGVVTINAGRITSVTVRDTYLLDDPYLADPNHASPFPSAYSWFTLVNKMGLRDSNLSPDFAVDAQTAERIYTQESGGQQVAGVIAISPTLIAHLLTITGPVYVPQYNVTVTSDNLVTLIHYYQFQTNDQGVPSGDGQSSTRKHFTAVLGEAFFARLRALSSSQQEQALQVGFNALKSKDLQVYLNNAAGEALLQKIHLSNSFGPPQTDTVEVVDNNVGGNKATAYVQEEVTDTVVVAPDDSSTHSLTITYTYKPQGNVYGRIAFKNVVQVYVPLGSRLISGFSPSNQTFTIATREFWSGYMTIQPNTSRRVTFTWKAPAPPDHAQGYELLVGRQADSVYSFSVSIQLPTSATHVQSFPPLTYANGRATYQTRGQQTTDLDLKLTW